jgi:hypothetical protein
MSFSRKANRAAARSAGLLKNPSGTPEDRQHLLDLNMGKLRCLHQKIPGDHALVICDTRDPVARIWATGGEAKSHITQHVMECALQHVIPTVFLSLPIAFAADFTSFHNPRISESLENRAPFWRYVIVIAGGGTSLVDVNLGAP